MGMKRVRRWIKTRRRADTPLIWILAAALGALVFAAVRPEAVGQQGAGFGIPMFKDAQPATPVGGRGIAIALDASDERRLAVLYRGSSRSYRAHIVQFAENQGHRYFRIPTNDGYCYSVSTKPASGAHLGPIVCAPGFPSSEEPLLDFSVVEGTSGEPKSAHLILVRGIAADNVSRVELAAADGTVVATIPVVSNVYELQNPPATAARVVARNSQGKQLIALP
jgi:hypothetical protein